MDDPTYTLKQVVSILSSRADTDPPAHRIARSIRHWTALDLLVPIAGKETGTGVSRRYTADEVRKAAILVELSRYRIPAPVLEETFPGVSEDWPERPAWRDAIAGRNPIFLFMTYSEALTAYQLIPADAVVTMLQPASDRPPEPQPDHMPKIEIYSAIVINVTRLFASLNL